MPYYKDIENHIHFLDSVDFEYLLPIGCIAISDLQADVMRGINKEEIKTEALSI